MTYVLGMLFTFHVMLHRQLEFRPEHDDIRNADRCGIRVPDQEPAPAPVSTVPSHGMRENDLAALLPGVGLSISQNRMPDRARDGDVAAGGTVCRRTHPISEQIQELHVWCRRPGTVVRMDPICADRVLPGKSYACPIVCNGNLSICEILRCRELALCEFLRANVVLDKLVISRGAAACAGNPDAFSELECRVPAQVVQYIIGRCAGGRATCPAGSGPWGYGSHLTGSIRRPVFMEPWLGRPRPNVGSCILNHKSHPGRRRVPEWHEPVRRQRSWC